MPDVSSHKPLKFDCLFFVEYFAMDLIMSFTALAETWVPWCPMSCCCGPWYSEVSCYSLLWKIDLSWRIFMDLPLFTYYSKHCNFHQFSTAMFNYQRIFKYAPASSGGYLKYGPYGALTAWWTMHGDSPCVFLKEFPLSLGCLIIEKISGPCTGTPRNSHKTL